MRFIPFIFSLSSLGLLTAGCAFDDGFQQLDELNMVQLFCTEGLQTSGIYIESIEEQIPTNTRQKVARLLIGAEIDSQFGNYPACLNRLERAYYYLSQIKPRG